MSCAPVNTDMTVFEWLPNAFMALQVFVSCIKLNQVELLFLIPSAQENFYMPVALLCLCLRGNDITNAENCVLFCRVGYAGDNFVRYTGDTISMAQTQRKWGLGLGFFEGN